MRRDVELHPLDIVEQHNRIFADVLQVPSLRRGIDVGVDEDLRLREIRDQHVVSVMETLERDTAR